MRGDKAAATLETLESRQMLTTVTISETAAGTGDLTGDGKVDSTDGFLIALVDSGARDETIKRLSGTTKTADQIKLAHLASAAVTSDPLTSEIHGQLWNDADRDGIKDANESPQVGFTVFLDNNQNGRLDSNEPSTVSDTNGNYAFTNLAAGNYTVVQVLPVADEAESDSTGIVSLAGVSETGFNPTGGDVRFNLSGAAFSSDPLATSIDLNGVAVPSSLIQISSSTIVVSGLLVAGRNNISLSSVDSQGYSISGGYVLWAGDQTLSVNVIDENNQLLNGAQVTAQLGDDPNISVQATSAGGVVQFQNVPNAALVLQGTAPDGRSAVTTLAGATSVTLKLSPLGTVSTISNNDISQGTAGWNVGSAPVTVITHVEDSSSLQAVQFLQAAELSDAATNQDLLLTTNGSGPQSISRAFKTQSDTRTVTVRYKVSLPHQAPFLPSTFSISGKTPSGALYTPSGTDAVLGGLSDAKGTSGWHEATLMVHGGDDIEITVLVSKAAAGAPDASITIDKVTESSLAIATFTLKDIDETKLTALSVDPANPYFSLSPPQLDSNGRLKNTDGRTLIHGTMTIQGPASAQLNSVALEIWQDGVKKATATLHDGLITEGQTLDSQGITIDPLSVLTSLPAAERALFELSTTEAAKIDDSHDGKLFLRAVADVTLHGGAQDSIASDFGSVPFLVRYTRSNRYGQDDRTLGGDDWVLPSVKAILESFPNVVYGDFSNMNGGDFPPHKSHNDGKNVDVKFAPTVDPYKTSPNNDLFAAKLITEILDTPAGNAITDLGVTYSNDDKFGRAIQGVFITNDTPGGRPATSVIKNWAGHDTHFHIRIDPSRSTAGPAPQSDLSVSGMVDKTTNVKQGDVVTYTFTVTNNGPKPSTRTSFSVKFDSPLTFVSPSGQDEPIVVSHPVNTDASTPAQALGNRTEFSGSFDSSSNTYTVSDVDSSDLAVLLAQNSTITIKIKMMVDGPVPGPIHARASVEHAETDPNSDNDATDVVVGQAQTMIAVTPRDITTTKAGGTGSFSVVLTQQPTASVVIPITSSSTAEGTLSAAALTFTSANWNTPQTVTVVGLNDGQTGDIPYFITLGPATSSDSAFNNQSGGLVMVTNQDVSADLAVTYSASASSVSRNGQITFTVTVMNNGPSPATQVRWIGNDNPSSTNIQSVNPSQGIATTDGLGADWNLGTLAPGAVATLAVVETVFNNALGDAHLGGFVSSPTADPNSNNNSGEINVPVVESAAFSTFAATSPGASPAVSAATTAALSGVVYIDANADGVLQTGESRLGGVLILLNGTDLQGIAVHREATTGSDGSYVFSSLQAGQYTLTDFQPVNYLEGPITVGSQGGSLVGRAISIALADGVSGSGNNFAEVGLNPDYRQSFPTTDFQTVTVIAGQIAGGINFGSYAVNETLTTVTLGVNPASINENGGVATFTATLSAAAPPGGVTVTLGFSGNATDPADYAKSGTQIVIAAGATEGTLTVTGVADAVVDPGEKVTVTITAALGATIAGTPVTVTISEAAATLAGDMDGDGQVTTQDGNLVTLMLLGASDSTLELLRTPGSMATAAQLKARFESNKTNLDVDNNGSTQSQDGNLIVLVKLGASDSILELLRGPANPPDTRNSATQINSFVQNLSAAPAAVSNTVNTLSAVGTDYVASAVGISSVNLTSKLFRIDDFFETIEDDPFLLEN